MMQVIPKWRVTVSFPAREITLWVYDHHTSNVLRQVSTMQFSENGLEEPTRIVVEKAVVEDGRT